MSKKTLDATYWEERYQTGQTGWDMGQVSPPLREIIDQQSDKTTSILIPGAGSAYEVDYLLQQGFQAVTVIDVAPAAIQRLRDRVGDRPEVRTIEGNFFEHLDQYDLILEQTFFCALERSLRLAYAKHMHKLLKPDGVLAGVLFGIQFPFDGPPFGGSVDEYEALFSPLFTIERLEPCTTSIKPRLGTELAVALRPRADVQAVI